MFCHSLLFVHWIIYGKSSVNISDTWTIDGLLTAYQLGCTFEVGPKIGAPCWSATRNAAAGSAQCSAGD